MESKSFSALAIFKVEVVMLIDDLTRRRDSESPESCGWSYLDGRVQGLRDAVKLLDKQMLEVENE